MRIHVRRVYAVTNQGGMDAGTGDEKPKNTVLVYVMHLQQEEKKMKMKKGQ